MCVCGMARHRLETVSLWLRALPCRLSHRPEHASAFERASGSVEEGVSSKIASEKERAYLLW